MKKHALILTAVLLVSITVIAFASGTSPLSGLISSLGKQDTVTITKQEYEQYQKYQKLEQVYQYIQQLYYVEPDEDAMMEMAIQGMLAGLEDPYTFYYNAEDWAKMWQEDEGNYAGIGTQLLGDYRTNVVTISRVFEGSPAQAAGVRKGDVLVRVENVAVTAQTMQEAVDIMRGTQGEMVEIEVLRKGEPIVFTMPRADVVVNRVEYMMLEDNVGYIALYAFEGDCATAFEQALKALKQQGATALVVDVRDNSGGWVGDAITIADLFMDRDTLFYEQDRTGDRENSYTTNGKDDIPMAVLVNEGSASSSEILSGGLSTAGRATLVGTKTFGKGITQAVVPLDDGTDGMQFTVSQYFLKDGTKVHNVGIMPDIYIAMPEELVGEYFEVGDMTDVQLKTAWETAVALRDGTALPASQPYPQVELDDAA